MKQTGTGAIILPHGVLFRGNAEAEIRKEIIDRGLIKAIIGLPANLFFGTGIPACIIVFDKKDANDRKGIFMIDASKGFVKDGPKNKLREQDIKKIVDAYEGQLNLPKFSRFVENEEIKVKNEYNLNIPRYIDTSEVEDLQSIEAHLHGGIPMEDVDSLNKYWEQFPNLKEKLFSKLRDGFYKLNIGKDDVRKTIYNDEQFASYFQKVDKAFSNWKAFADKKLRAMNEEVKPKELIVELSNKLISEFETIELIDKYDVYEVLLEYWQETMLDDTSLICSDNGWNEAKEIELEFAKTKRVKEGEEKKPKKEPKATDWHGKIISRELLASVYFSDAVLTIENANNAVAEKQGILQSLIEENSDDDSIFNECMNGKNEVTAKLVETRFKELKKSNQLDEDYNLLKQYVDINNIIKQLNKDLKTLNAGLEEDLKKKYPILTVEEIKNILINKKWLKIVYDNIKNLYTTISDNIANRIVELVERYENTLSEIEYKVNSYETKVKENLKRMGFELFEKKKLIKQGVMQDFLTGKKKCLPSFNREWSEKELGELGEFTGGGVDKKSIPGQKTVTLLNFLDVYHRDFIYKKELYHKVSASDAQIRKCTLKKGDLFFTPSSELRTDVALSAVVMEDCPGCVYSYHITRFRFKDEFDLKFKSYMFNNKSFLNQAALVAEGSGKRYVVNLSKFKTLTITYPTDIKEQSAIAEIL